MMYISKKLVWVLLIFLIYACTKNTPGLKAPEEFSSEKQGLPISQNKRLYVNHSSIGKNTGDSWEDAYLTLHQALDDPRLGKSIWEVWVGKGTYYPPEVNPEKFNYGSFVLQDGVALYGGFRGDELTLTNRDFKENQTILTQKSEAKQWSSHIMIADSLSKGIRIDGFIIQGGRGDENGAAIVIIDTPFAMDNCLIQNNHTNEQNRGGGLSFWGNAPVTIEKTVFKNNSAGAGGAIHLTGNNEPIHLHQCQFIHNQATNGPGGAILLDAQSSGENIGNFNLNDSFFYENESIMAMGHAIHGNANSKWDITPHYRTEGEILNNIFWGIPDDGSLIALSQNSSVIKMSNNTVENLKSTGIYTEHKDSVVKILKGNSSDKPDNLKKLIGLEKKAKNQMEPGKIDLPVSD